VTAELAHSISLLPRLNEVDRQLRSCHAELRSTPLGIEAEGGALEVLSGQLLDAEGALATAEEQLGSAQSSLSGLEKRLDRARSRVASLTNAEQIDATEREMASLEAQCSDGETAVLEGMEAVETLESQRQRLSTQLAAGQGAHDSRQAEWAERSGVLEAQVLALDGSRSELRSAVRKDVLRLYEAALGRGPIGASEPSGITHVDSRFICATCHARVPPAWVQEARNHRSIQTCDGCRRVLLLSDPSASGDLESAASDQPNSPN